MSDPAPQLTLDLFGSSSHDFAGFHREGNDETVTALEHWSRGLGPPVIYLWGAGGSGKSHLLQAAIRAADQHGARAMYLPLAAVGSADSEVFDGLERVDMLAIDDLGACRGAADWERRLFHLYNALTAGGGRLLWAARTAPARGPFELADLASRLAASLVYQLRELDDTQKSRALAAAAARRGLSLEPAVIAFIMRRERRDMAALAEILDALDRASLRDARALTIPFVRSVLARAPAAGRAR